MFRRYLKHSILLKRPKIRRQLRLKGNILEPWHDSCIYELLLNQKWFDASVEPKVAVLNKHV